MNFIVAEIDRTAGTERDESLSYGDSYESLALFRRWPGIGLLTCSIGEAYHFASLPAIQSIVKFGLA